MILDMAVTAQYTEPLNSMVSPEHRRYVEQRAEELNTSRASIVREALDVLMEQRPVEA